MSLTWAQFTAIPNNTRIFNFGYDQCVALANHYHINVLGGRFVGVQAAHEWWTKKWAAVDEIYTKSLYPVPGAVFVSRGGIYDRVFGHIGVVTSVLPNGSFTTMEQNAAIRYVGRYTRANDDSIYGFLIPKKNPASSQKLSDTQRQVHPSSPVFRRAEPTTKSKKIDPELKPGEIGNFDGWIRGESVSGNNVWFRGISGNWFWSGGFTNTKTTGLKDLNAPVIPKPGKGERQVAPIELNVRETPNTSSKIVSSLAANAIVKIDGWIKGQKVQNVDIWFKVAGGYAWAYGFTSTSTADLKDLNPKTPPVVDPPTPTDPTGPVDNDFGSPGSVLATIDRWSESAPDWGKAGFERPTPASVYLEFPDHIEERIVRPDRGFYHGREGKPNHFGLHHAVSPYLDGTVDSLMGQNDNSANAVVKDDVVVYMVDSRDTPSTNGRWRSNVYSFTIEACNDVTTTDKPSEKTHETIAWVVAREALSWGMKLPLAHLETVFGHKTLSKSATACPGKLDVEWITDRANEIIEAHLSEEKTPEPNYDALRELTDAVKDLQNKVDAQTNVGNKILDFLKSIFRGGN